MVYQNNHGVTIEGIEVFGEVKGMHHNHWPSTIVRDFVEKKVARQLGPFFQVTRSLKSAELGYILRILLQMKQNLDLPVLTEMFSPLVK